MRSLALALALLLASPGLAGACRPVLVSGFDDVMRQADNTGLLRAARRLLSPDLTYAGMPELYQELTCPDIEPRMYVVSAITASLETRARTFLARAGFPSSQLYFRRWLLQWSQERFKWARIEWLLTRHAGQRFIFVLDNSPTSVRLSQRLLTSHPSRIAAVYLRETVRRELPAGATPFLTAFEWRRRCSRPPIRTTSSRRTRTARQRGLRVRAARPRSLRSASACARWYRRSAQRDHGVLQRQLKGREPGDVSATLA